MTEAEKKADMKKVNGVFEMKIKNAAGKEGIWTVDFKKVGEVYAGPAKQKADVTISLSDDTFQNVRLSLSLSVLVLAMSRKLWEDVLLPGAMKWGHRRG